MSPFVLPVDEPERDRRDDYDLYAPADRTGPSPAIVFLPGMYSADWTPPARDWPTYVGYGATAVACGAVGVVADLALHEPSGYPHAAHVAAAVIEDLRRDPRVDRGRIAVWAFSGGALVTATWLRDPPSWLRCLALSYPVLAPLPGWRVDAAFHAADVLAPTAPPIVLTRVGRDHPDVAATVPPFLRTAERIGVSVDVLEVPDGQHAFDSLDHTEASRTAVRAAFRRVTEHLQTP